MRMDEPAATMYGISHASLSCFTSGFLPKSQPLCPPTSSCESVPPRVVGVLWKLRACPGKLARENATL
eukprot:CAMPEP_0179486520 /NCGR_PEP_ID=MMETSP0799-20121207/62793_1 /TAXON_ID=46947 /ORGANISM="Geminigera cryophila, Strain CCMP2564" /LENGTH=67 /DNA_ID=CAMNT_0021301299 /DNA_START=703 /DNA_END=906 /DNA_ORIENTATION=-